MWQFLLGGGGEVDHINDVKQKFNYLVGEVAKMFIEVGTAGVISFHLQYMDVLLYVFSTLFLAILISAGV